MKKILYFLPLLFAVVYFGCSAEAEIASMSPDERFEYAKGLYEDEDYLEAAVQFEALLLQFPGNEVADDAQYYLAKTRFEREEYLIAAYEFSKLIRNMPASQYVPDSQYMLATSYYELSPSYQLDQRYTEKSIEEYQAFIDFFPIDEKVSEAEQRISEMNDKLAEKMFMNAVIYERMEYFTAAIFYYDKVLEVYHDSRFAPDASYRKIQLLLDRDDDESALREVNRFLSMYSENENYANVKEIQEELLQSEETEQSEEERI